MTRLLPIVLAVALGLAACSAEETMAARVGDEIITRGEVVALRSTEAAAVPAGVFRDDLSRLIFQKIVQQALEDEFDVVISRGDVDDELATMLAGFTQNGQTLQQALGSEATQELARRNAEATLLRLAAVDELGRDPAFLDSLLADDPDLVTEVCVRHVLVPDRAAAEEVIARLGAGEDFADVATEVSLDEGTPGGDLGCSVAARYVTEFADAALVAPVGEVFGPIETQFGFHVLIVDERTQPTIEELRADPQAYVPAEIIQEEFIRWFNAKVDEADIEIASDIGTWDAEARGIEPPADPEG